MRTRTNYRSRMRNRSLPEPILSYMRRHRASVVFSGMFIAGVALGSSAVRTLSGDLAQGLAALLRGFVDARTTQALGQTLASSLSQNLVLIIILFFSGFCAIAAPIIYMVPLFKGLGYGLTAAALLAVYGVRALPFVGFLLLPNTLLSALIIVAACEEALKMSRTFLAVIRPIDPPRSSGSPTPGRYCLKFGLFSLAMVGGALLESYLFLLGAGLFGLGNPG